VGVGGSVAVGTGRAVPVKVGTGVKVGVGASGARVAVRVASAGGAPAALQDARMKAASRLVIHLKNKFLLLIKPLPL